MKAKILVVDDDPDIMTVLQDRLESLGYETVTASTVSARWRRSNAKRPE